MLYDGAAAYMCVCTGCCCSSVGNSMAAEIRYRDSSFCTQRAPRRSPSPLSGFPSCSLHLSEPTARSLPDVVADKICCCRGLHMIRRTILLQNSHNRMQHCARRPPLADNLTTVAQGRLRGSFRRCWLRRRSVQQTALCGCKRCSSERCALQNSCYALLTALCELGWLRARHALANVFTADC